MKKIEESVLQNNKLLKSRAWHLPGHTKYVGETISFWLNYKDYCTLVGSSKQICSRVFYEEEDDLLYKEENLNKGEWECLKFDEILVSNNRCFGLREFARWNKEKVRPEDSFKTLSSEIMVIPTHWTWCLMFYLLFTDRFFWCFFV